MSPSSLLCCTIVSLDVDAVGSLWPFAAGPIASAVIRVAVLCVTLAVIASGDRAIAWVRVPVNVTPSAHIALMYVHLFQSTGWLSSVVLSAYLFFPVVIFATGASLDPSALGPNGVPKNISLFLLINRVVWNMSGWAQVGGVFPSACCAVAIHVCKAPSGWRTRLFSKRSSGKLPSRDIACCVRTAICIHVACAVGLRCRCSSCLNCVSSL